MAPSDRHSHQPAGTKALQLRLRKIAGQVQSIERMLDVERDCAEILTQVVSARRALKSFAEALMQRHFEECIAGSASQEESQSRLRDLLKVLERYVE
ncbi:MAG: metal-sensitive transcriptional regulator [Verrucomicrobia bacterium]|jgi:DNA-binding FrmR family transcriptional regulator|nr:metal-sensitive transcriptional regulator [Verrucomicrobiota bacterium]